jgi:hypothetical protein
MATPILVIGELVESQASKYITVNEALRKIEACTIRVLSQTNSGPPGGPSDGDAYIVDVTSDDWSGFTIKDIAYYSNTSWYNLSPFEGLRVWVNDDDGLYVYNGSAWTLLVAAGGSHARAHDIDSTADHNGVGSAVEDNLISFDSNALPQDSGINPDLIIKCVASETVGMQNGDGKSILYTVPADKSFIPTHIIIRNPTASLADGNDYDIGDGVDADTWKTAIDLSSLTVATDCIVISNDNSKFTIFDAADEFGIKPVTGATADADATVDVFGYLF